MILVAGATGELGRAICRKLVERGGTVYGMVRAHVRAGGGRGAGGDGRDAVRADLASRSRCARPAAAATRWSRA
jgi:nucleoside-diphosphate-sugar epimerase